MGQLLGISIDVTKIDKSKLKDGKYLNITASVNDEPNQYGQDVSVWHEQTKEEREAKVNRIFLGNGKKLWTSVPEPQRVEAKQDDDLPF
jgi:hypothetical protein